MNGPINSFSGDYRWLSNFAPAEVLFESGVYPTVENAYQAAKAPESRRTPFLTCTPGQAKRLGRSFSLPVGWDSERVVIMRCLLEDKFRQQGFRAALLATGDRVLVEGNTWGDRFWGVCDGVGQNMLGRLLMEIRRSYAG